MLNAKALANAAEPLIGALTCWWATLPYAEFSPNPNVALAAVSHMKRARPNRLRPPISDRPVAQQPYFRRRVI